MMLGPGIVQSPTPFLMKTETAKPAKWLLAVPWLLVLAGLCTGCGGFSATKSISPLDFLLPGLHIQNDRRAPGMPEATNVVAACQSPAQFPTAAWRAPSLIGE